MNELRSKFMGLEKEDDGEMFTGEWLDIHGGGNSGSDDSADDDDEAS